MNSSHNIQKSIVSVFFAFVCVSNAVHCQNFYKPNQWKKFKKEFYLGIGLSNFLGDLGGLDRKGTDYSIVDLERKLSMISMVSGYRCHLTKNVSYKTEFSFLRVSGNDALTKDIYRNNRNLNFKSNVFEHQHSIELGAFITKAGNRYRLKKTLVSRHKSNGQYIYSSVGVGVFFFNPKGYYRGKWYYLRQLSTEGQGLPGGPKPYKRYSICIPISVGYKLVLPNRYTLSFEFCFRKTFTDYLDDVHGVYFDKKILYEYKGQDAVNLSDPSKQLIPGATMPDASGLGAQRGDKEKDSYMNLTVRLGYSLKKKKKVKHLRTKF